MYLLIIDDDCNLMEKMANPIIVYRFTIYQFYHVGHFSSECTKLIILKFIGYRHELRLTVNPLQRSYYCSSSHHVRIVGQHSKINNLLNSLVGTTYRSIIKVVMNYV